MSNLLYESAIDRLAGVRHAPPRAGQARAARAYCPVCQSDGAKPGRQPSLSVALTNNGMMLVHCFKGCGAAEIFVAMQIDKFQQRSVGEAVELSGRREPGGWMTAAALADALVDAAILAAAHFDDADAVFRMTDIRDSFKAAAREAMKGGQK